MTALSIETGILCEFTALIGVGKKIREANDNYISDMSLTSGQRSGHGNYNSCNVGSVFQIFVETCTGRHIPILIGSENKIKDVKGRFMERGGISIDQQRFIFAGMELKDGKTIQDYKIQTHSTLHLVLRLRGGGGPMPVTDIAATALVLSYLKKFLLAIESLWEMMYSKALISLITRFSDIDWESSLLEFTNLITKH
jgi:hypothetical protein